MSIDSNVILYGTSDAPIPQKSVRLGPLSFVYTPDSVRRICWHGTELVRAIAWPIRDENWGTFQPDLLEERVDETDGTFAAHLKFAVADGRLTCVLKIVAGESGGLTLELSMTPTGGPFATNRAGFTVLHPIKGIAGAPLQVTHSDGAVEETVFPRLISAGQPVFDIHGLSYGLDGRSVDIAFDGDVFEMEDQRNWSDASYKTYCVPLVYPFTYEIDGPKTQTVKVTLSGSAPGRDTAPTDPGLVFQKFDGTAPAIGLALEPGWLGDERVIRDSGVQHLVARIGPTADDAFLARLAEVSGKCELDLEVVVPDRTDPEKALAEIRAGIGQSGLEPTRIMALPERYLGSFQPTGPWPEGATPGQVVAAARAVFPGADIGGGMLSNFTEFNRCPPDPAHCDFVTHASSAIVHAGDDLSVCETLEALPQIFESAVALAGGNSYRLGLVSIGMRTNPYGSQLAHNPAQVRHTMAHEDPRQRGLFAAAWAVGVLAATQGQAVASLCLAAPAGPFGMSYSKQDYPQAYFDDTKGTSVYPIFHVIRTAAAMAGHPRRRLLGLPDGLYGYGAGAGLMIANASSRAMSLRLGQSARVAILDSAAFAAATTDIDWLRNAPRHNATELTLEGYAVAFADI